MDIRFCSRQFKLSQSAISLVGTGAAVVIAVIALGVAADRDFRRERRRSADTAERLVANDKSSREASGSGAVGTQPDPQPEIEFFPVPTPSEKRILEALSRPVDVDFHELPLEKCIAFLEKESAVPIRIDCNRGDPESRVQLDVPVTLKVKGSRLETVLTLLLQPNDFVLVFENDALMITTSVVASETLITRTYPVSDLYMGRQNVDVSKLPRERTSGGGKNPPPPVYSDLEEALVKTIEPDSWGELSGPGDYCYVKETGSLVIRQSWGVHRKILQLLRDLRAAKRLMRTLPPDRRDPRR